MTTRINLNPQVAADVLAAMGAAPDIHWILGDYQCDCTFQRIGEWKNPYLGKTLRVRMCCIWAALYQQYPQYVQEISAYYDSNRDHYETEPQPWDSEEMAMPVYLWYRQIAAKTGASLESVRAEYQHRLHERPQAVPKGQGWESRSAPTDEEIATARAIQLRASGWLL